MAAALSITGAQAMRRTFHGAGRSMQGCDRARSSRGWGSGVGGQATGRASRGSRPVVREEQRRPGRWWWCCSWVSSCVGAGGVPIRWGAPVVGVVG